MCINFTDRAFCLVRLSYQITVLLWSYGEITAYGCNFGGHSNIPVFENDEITSKLTKKFGVSGYSMAFLSTLG